MLREENNKPISRPMPKPMPRREYEYPEYESPRYEKPKYERPGYECPDYDYPMMPDYPNNMNPCPYPYPEYDMYGGREMNLEEMVRRNPALKRCVMDCVERHNNRYPCRPMPRPTPRPRRNPCRCNDYDAYSTYEPYKVKDYSYAEEIETYDFSEDTVESLSEDLNEIEIENKEE